MKTLDPQVEALKERAWRETAAIDRALADGDIDEAGWHAAMAALVGPAYLASDTPYGQAGHSGDAAAWEASRGFIADAVDRHGSFLDAGCASGILMESVFRWARDKGLDVEPYGVEIIPDLAELARRRLPHWAERIHVGNVRTWSLPGQRFDYVLVRPEYAPPGQRRALLHHLIANVVAPDGRLVVLVGTEEADERASERELTAGGLTVAGRAERVHPLHQGLRRRLFWIDGVRRRQP